jgi:hypothetical protein
MGRKVDMNAMESDLFQAIARVMRREAERRMIAGISEWAYLEPVGDREHLDRQPASHRPVTGGEA